MSEEEISKVRSSGKFSNIFLIGALLLVTLPFISTFNEFLTSLFLRWELYRVLQEFVVPYEAKVIAGLLNTVGLASEAVPKGVWVQGLYIEIQWNCLGWQSGVLLLASFMTGFQGKFTNLSRMEVILIGVLGSIDVFSITC